MVKIDILCVGKLKESYLREGVSEYEKRLRRYCSLQIIEVADEKTPDDPSERERDLILEKEAERLSGRIEERAYVIALAIEGKQFDSVELSEKLQTVMSDGYGYIQFVIGGSLGLHKSLLQRANLKLSFSKLTFPHQLMRMILAEQLYRSFRIAAGEPYHK